MAIKLSGIYFYGNEASDYAKENNRLDYATFAKAFNHVLNNNILERTIAAGEYWEEENTEYFEDLSGNIYTTEEAEEKREELEAMKEETENEAELEEIEAELEALEEPHYKDIFQYYIVDDNGAEILREAGEALYYNENLDMYIWGVDHWGTAWTHVLTNIPLNYKES